MQSLNTKCLLDGCCSVFPEQERHVLFVGNIILTPLMSIFYLETRREEREAKVWYGVKRTTWIPGYLLGDHVLVRTSAIA